MSTRSLPYLVDRYGNPIRFILCLCHEFLLSPFDSSSLQSRGKGILILVYM